MNNLLFFLEYTGLISYHHGAARRGDGARTKAHQFAGLCLPPFWIKKARRELGSADASLITVVGHPFGYQMTQTKIGRNPAGAARRGRRTAGCPEPVGL